MVRQHHLLSGYEFEQTLRESKGQRNLAWCSPWGHKESYTAQQLNNHTSYLYNRLNGWPLHLHLYMSSLQAIPVSPPCDFGLGHVYALISDMWAEVTLSLNFKRLQVFLLSRLCFCILSSIPQLALWPQREDKEIHREEPFLLIYKQSSYRSSRVAQLRPGQVSQTPGQPADM